MQALFCLFFLGVFLVGCSRVDPPSPVERPRGGTSSDQSLENSHQKGINKIQRVETTHVVKPGETTLQISRMYQMREDELVRMNHIEPPFLLTPGQTLTVYKPQSDSQESLVDTRVQKEEDVEVTPLETIQPAIDGGATAGGALVGVATGVASHQPFAMPEETAQHVAPESSSGAPKKAVSASGWQAPLSNGKIIYRMGDTLPDGSKCDGITWKAPKGTPVFATQSGEIKEAGKKISAYGNMIVLRHMDGKKSVYAHLDNITTKVGEHVEKGQQIGTVGSTGQVNEPQLHFQIRGDKLKPIDPLSLIS